MRRVALLAIVLTVSLGSLVPSSAWAQAAEQPAEADTERARALFSEAIELADAGDWERAVHRFRAALALRDAPTIRYNLASSLARLNQVLQALDELDHVDASAETTPELREQAAALRASLQPRLGRLRVDVRGDAVGTHVTVDGAPWEPVGRSAVSNPGIVMVRLWRGEAELDQAEVDVADGGEAAVVLRVPLPVVDGGASDGSGALGADGGSDDGLFIGLGVTAAILVVIGAVLVGVFVADANGPQPSMGDFSPAILRVD